MSNVEYQISKFSIRYWTFVLDHYYRVKQSAYPLECRLRIADCPPHLRRPRLHILAVGFRPASETSYHDQRPRHLAAFRIRVGKPGGQQRTEERKRGRILE